VDEALNGVRTLLKVAFDIKDSPPILKELDEDLVLPKAPSMQMPEPRVIFAPVLQDKVAFTVTKNWMDRVVKVFDPFDMHGCKKTERTQASLDLVQERATKFGNVCRSRLYQHLLSRGFVSKSTHWAYP
jgi:hypothetical protein